MMVQQTVHEPQDLVGFAFADETWLMAIISRTLHAARKQAPARTQASGKRSYGGSC
jgi:hypothetical protein